ncbi:hypothetical protein HK098_000064 [Nowakowskiella sp. JEL0407]|nr:hypothetical protein HK098_000064 [Nowakowskiella sp. JEL0407]
MNVRSEKSCLATLKECVSNSRKLDAVISKSIRSIQEIELIAHGYKLSVVLSPISRIERSIRNKRCLTLRKCLYKNIYVVNSLIDELVGAESNFTDEKARDDEILLEKLKSIWLASTDKRIKFLSNLISFDTSTEFTTEILGRLSVVLKSAVLDISDTLNNEFNIYSYLKPDFESNEKQVDTQWEKLHPILSNVDQSSQMIKTRLYLCYEDLKAKNTEQLMDRLAYLEKDISNLLETWKQSQRALNKIQYHEPEPESNHSAAIPNSDQVVPIAEPEISNKISEDTEIEIPERLVYEEDMTDLESTKDVATKKLSREERIRIRKKKLEEEAQEREKVLSRVQMVDELKDVLRQRNS